MWAKHIFYKDFLQKFYGGHFALRLKGLGEWGCQYVRPNMSDSRPNLSLWKSQEIQTPFSFPLLRPLPLGQSKVTSPGKHEISRRWKKNILCFCWSAETEMPQRIKISTYFEILTFSPFPVPNFGQYHFVWNDGDCWRPPTIVSLLSQKLCSIKKTKKLQSSQPEVVLHENPKSQWLLWWSLLS